MTTTDKPPFTAAQVLAYLQRWKWIQITPRNQAAIKELYARKLISKRGNKYIVKGKAE